MTGAHWNTTLWHECKKFYLSSFFYLDAEVGLFCTKSEFRWEPKSLIIILQLWQRAPWVPAVYLVAIHTGNRNMSVRWDEWHGWRRQSFITIRIRAVILRLHSGGWTWWSQAHNEQSFTWRQGPAIGQALQGEALSSWGLVWTKSGRFISYER